MNFQTLKMAILIFTYHGKTSKGDKMTKKELFEKYKAVKDNVLAITLFVRMPTGETESIENTNVVAKMDYIDKAYDDNLVHKNNESIFIEDVYFLLDTDEMDFGSALHYLKEGCKIGHKTWSENAYLYYVPEEEYAPCTDIAKNEFGGKNVPYQAYVAMKTVDGNVVPWAAGHSDLLAEDWIVML